MKLTVAEIGHAEFDKAWHDKAWFRGIALSAKIHAAERGNFCVEQIRNLQSALAADPDSTDYRAPHHLDRFERDAIMCARMAYKGWRAYRVMVGE